MALIYAKEALLDEGWAKDVIVEVDKDGVIERVQSGIIESAEDTHNVGVLLPSPANAHSHAFQRAMAGLTERRGPEGSDSFWTWRQLMYRFLDHLTPDHVEAIAAFVQMEMLEAGYATNVEFHYLHHQPDGQAYDNIAEMAERIAAAAAQTGIGLTLLPVHYEFSGLDRGPLGNGQKRFGNSLDQFEALHGTSANVLKDLPADARIGVAPHSLRAVDGRDLPSLIALSPDGPVHMHIAEQQREVNEVQHATGKRPVEWLLEHAELNGRWCLIHCTQMEPHETKELALTGAIAGLCPITESNLGDGIFDGVRWLENYGRIAIGSDSNIRITLSEELRTLEYSQRLRDQSRAALAGTGASTGRRLWQAASHGGAKAAGRNAGAIEEGRLADLVALKDDSIQLIGKSGDLLLDSFVFAGDDRLITDVWAAGRHMVADGIHRNRELISKNYIKVLSELGEII
jgi:formimidoylglutamate deiminase